MSSYTREMVQELVPTIWDRQYVWGMVDDERPDPDMPKAKGPKNAKNTLWAYLADIRVAWDRAPLSIKERQALVLCGGLDLNFVLGGVVLGIRKQSAQERYERGIGKLTDFLNGTSNTVDDEDEEPYYQ